MFLQWNRDVVRLLTIHSLELIAFSQECCPKVDKPWFMQTIVLILYKTKCTSMEAHCNYFIMSSGKPLIQIANIVNKHRFMNSYMNIVSSVKQLTKFFLLIYK